MNRRNLLTASSSLLGIGLGGCITSPRTTNPEPETRSAATENPSNTPERTATSTTEKTTDLTYPFYVLNKSGSSQCISIEITDVSNGETLIDTVYAIPNGRVLEFRDISTVGVEYSVVCAFEDGSEVRQEWVAEKCLECAGGADVEKAGYIKKYLDQSFFATTSCDAVNRELTDSPHILRTEASECDFNTE